MSIKKIIGLVLVLLMVNACSPKVGSKAWCKEMKAKPKGDWTLNETKDYTESCII